MRDIRLGTLGEIVAGDGAGGFVEVVDDWADSGGFLILAFDKRDRSGTGYDSWVETIVDVDLYFDENNWTIQWID